MDWVKWERGDGDDDSFNSIVSYRASSIYENGRGCKVKGKGVEVDEPENLAMVKCGQSRANSRHKMETDHPSNAK